MHTAPFPYAGGKRRIAPIVWEQFGTVGRYIEPFAGSLAVLLANPHPPNIEIICDLDCMIPNFWRAIAADPEAVAFHADYPTFHSDLTARHKWLVDRQPEVAHNCNDDADWFDAQVAGWWVWGISHWIGGGFCSTSATSIPRIDSRDGGRGVSIQRKKIPNKRPHIDKSGGGAGISVQRKNTPIDKRPHVNIKGGGQGVSLQRKDIPSGKRPIVHHSGGGAGVSVQRKNMPSGQIPQVDHKGGGSGVSIQRKTIPTGQIPKVNSRSGGNGVSAQRTGIEQPLTPHNRGDRLIEWFYQLAARLGKCVVLCRGWESAVSPTLLGNTTTQNTDTAIFLDPPYRTSGNRRAASLYASDFDGTSEDTATAAYEWAIEHGNKLKVAYCCRDGDFPVPTGWTAHTGTMVGYGRQREGDDMVMFSPRCAGMPRQQLSLFD